MPAVLDAPAPPIAAVTIRRATPEDGPAIGTLFRDTDWPESGLDWTAPGIADWWVVAEWEGAIVGAVQVTCSQPVAYIGDLIVHRGWRGRRFDGRGALSRRGSALARLLYAAAEEAMRRSGVQSITAVLRPSAGWRRLAERQGWAARLEGVTLMRKDLR